MTTNVQANGERIVSHNMGKNQSETIRKQIEREYGLVQAEKQKREEYKLKPVAAKVLYGKKETKKAIQEVLDALLPNYKYTSLHELNALLGLYNVKAERGVPDSRMYKAGGLVYRVLNERGENDSKSIRASDFFTKPTLKYLTAKFKENEVEDLRHVKRLRNAINLAFQQQKMASLRRLQWELSKDSIDLVLRKNDKGAVYGLTFIDHQNRCVYNGSDLGKAYSANAIQERLHKSPVTLTPRVILNEEKQVNKPSISLAPITQQFKEAIQQIFNELTSEEYAGSLAYELRENERRKRKQKIKH